MSAGYQTTQFVQKKTWNESIICNTLRPQLGKIEYSRWNKKKRNFVRNIIICKSRKDETTIRHDMNQQKYFCTQVVNVIICVSNFLMLRVLGKPLMFYSCVLLERELHFFLYINNTKNKQLPQNCPKNETTLMGRICTNNSKTLRNLDIQGDPNKIITSNWNWNWVTLYLNDHLEFRSKFKELLNNLFAANFIVELNNFSAGQI